MELGAGSRHLFAHRASIAAAIGAPLMSSATNKGTMIVVAARRRFGAPMHQDIQHVLFDEARIRSRVASSARTSASATSARTWSWWRCSRAASSSSRT